MRRCTRLWEPKLEKVQCTGNTESYEFDDALMIGDDAHQETRTFQIKSLQDAEDFAVLLSRYGERTFPGYSIREHIRNTYNYSRIHSDDERINGKLLNAVVDLELTYLFMMKDSQLAGGIHNRLDDAGKIVSTSVLQDFDLFSGKVDILYALSALSLRLRAFWDKYAGVLFLLYEFQEYDNFIGARRRRRFFVRKANDWPEISLHLRKCLTNIIRTWLIHSGQREGAREIDSRKFVVPFPDPFLKIMDDAIGMVDEIRTPEAHGSGFLRKWSLANLPIDRSRDFSLMNHWNVANEFMHALRATIGDYSAQNSSPGR